MKTQFLSLFAVTGLFVSSCVASPLSPLSIEKRQNNAALSILTDLFSTIQGLDATINSTTAGITSNSTVDQKAAATTIVNSAILNITEAVNSATVSVNASNGTASNGTASTAIPHYRLPIRQSALATEVAANIEEILEELSGTINTAISTLGLPAITLFTIPLTLALSQLIAALEVVVEDLLTTVQELLDGILSGLSFALDGLTL